MLERESSRAKRIAMRCSTAQGGAASLQGLWQDKKQESLFSSMKWQQESAMASATERSLQETGASMQQWRAQLKPSRNDVAKEKSSYQTGKGEAQSTNWQQVQQQVGQRRSPTARLDKKMNWTKGWTIYKHKASKLQRIMKKLWQVFEERSPQLINNI